MQTTLREERIVNAAQCWPQSAIDSMYVIVQWSTTGSTEKTKLHFGHSSRITTYIACEERIVDTARIVLCV